MAQRDVSLGRHRRLCSVCQHAECEEIEAAFISWTSPASIAVEYGLSDRASVYRHAHAVGLFSKRQRNIRAALERIIEKAGEVEVTAAAVVSAVQAYSEINAAGQWIDRSEQLSLNDLFDRMSTEELEQYAQQGTLTRWFEVTSLSANVGSPGSERPRLLDECDLGGRGAHYPREAAPRSGEAHGIRVSRADSPNAPSHAPHRRLGERREVVPHPKSL
jgi:hypothetical protein